MAKGLIRIDPVNQVYEINGKDFGQYCTGAEIKIVPNNLPEITLHLTVDADIEAVGEIQIWYTSRDLP